MLEFYRDWGAELPDELSTTIVLMRESPDPSIEGPVLAVRAAYAGPRPDAMVALRPLWDAAGPALAGDFRSGRFADVRPSAAPRRARSSSTATCPTRSSTARSRRS